MLWCFCARPWTNLVWFCLGTLLLQSPQTLCKEKPSDFFKDLFGNDLNPYEVLNISKEATDAEVKSTFHKLAMETHPDRNPDDRENAEKRFRDIALAYEVLKHPKRRKQYDAFGHFGGPVFEDLDKNFHVMDIMQEFFQSDDFKNAQNMSDMYEGGKKAGERIAAKTPDIGEKLRSQIKATPETLGSIEDALSSLKDLAGTIDTQGARKAGKGGSGGGLDDVSSDKLKKSLEALGEMGKSFGGNLGGSNAKMDEIVHKAKAAIAAGTGSKTGKGGMPNMKDALKGLSGLGINPDLMKQAFGGLGVNGFEGFGDSEEGEHEEL